MATFRVTIEIGPMDQSRFEQIEALVDTGATYTVVPSNVLERLGITPQFRRRFRICVFGEPETDVLLGRVTLQSLGLKVDTLKQRLVPAELPLIGFGIA